MESSDTAPLCQMLLVIWACEVSLGALFIVLIVLINSTVACVRHIFGILLGILLDVLFSGSFLFRSWRVFVFCFWLSGSLRRTVSSSSVGVEHRIVELLHSETQSSRSLHGPGGQN